MLDSLQQLLESVCEPLTLGLVIALATIALSLIVWMSSRSRRARKQIESIVPGNQVGGDHGSLAWSLRREIMRSLSDGRQLLREHPEQTVNGWLEYQVLHSLPFEAGGWITGLALVFTFLLIALVLASDVGPAIQDTSNVDALSSAVEKMGAKFTISMLGIVLTILHGIVRHRRTFQLKDAAAKLASRLAESSTVLVDYQAELDERTASEAGRLREVLTTQHQAITARLADLTQSVATLGSIEVSVKDIGSELAIKLQNVVRSDIVAGICENLETLTDRVCDALQSSFAKTVEKQIGLVKEELQKIERAVSSQGQGQVEQLLHKLGDIVSGGFTTESTKMKEALQQLIEGMPLLTGQLRSFIAETSADLAKRGTETMQMNEELVRKLHSVLAGVESQQQSNISMSERLSAWVVQVDQTMTRAMTDAHEQMTARSRLSLDEFMSVVKTATNDASTGYRVLVKEVESALADLRAARGAAAETAQHLDRSASSVKDVARLVNESVGSLRHVSDALAQNVDNARSTVTNGAEALRRSEAVVQRHQQFIQDLVAMWPQITKAYLDSTNDAFDRVAKEWKRCAEGIENSVCRISTGFNESASEFAVSVEDLGKHVESLNGTLYGAGKPSARTA